MSDIEVPEGWAAVEITDPAEAKPWAKDLLAAAGDEQHDDVKTEHHRGSVIVFVVPNDVYERALAARKERADAAEAEEANKPKPTKATKAAAAAAPPAPPAAPPAAPAKAAKATPSAAPAAGEPDAGAAPVGDASKGDADGKVAAQ
jgi:hypothetical protein